MPLDTYRGCSISSWSATGRQWPGYRAAALENSWQGGRCGHGSKTHSPRRHQWPGARYEAAWCRPCRHPVGGKQVGTQRSTLETALAKLSEPRVKMEAPAASSASSAPATGGPAEFTKTLLPHAQQAAQELGWRRIWWWRTPHWKAAGAKNPFAMPTAATVTTCSASKPVVAGKADRGHSHHGIRRWRAAKAGGAFPRLRQLSGCFCRLRSPDQEQPTPTKVRSTKGTDAAGLPVAWRVVYATDPNYAAKQCSWPKSSS